MWSTSVTNTDSEVASSVNLFNIYDILEPEKVKSNDKNDSTAVLIDVSDNTNKSEDNIDLPLDLCGSFIDRTKTEYDLVDLYQNMYVTPQQVKPKVYPKNDLRHTNEDSQTDFTEFFEKLESGHKFDWNKCNNNVRHFSHSNNIGDSNTHDFPHFNGIHTLPRSFDDILDNAISLRSSEPKLVSDTKAEHGKPDQLSGYDLDKLLQPKAQTQLFLNETIQESEDATFSNSVIDISSSVAEHYNSRSSAEIQNRYKILNNERSLNTILDNVSKPSSRLSLESKYLKDDNDLQIDEELASHVFLTKTKKEDRTQSPLGDPSCCCAISSGSPKTNLALNKVLPINTVMMKYSPQHPIIERLHVKKEKLTGLQNNNAKPQTSMKLLTEKYQSDKTVLLDNSFDLYRYGKELKSDIIAPNSTEAASTRQNYSVPTLQTVKKDNKAYAKRRIVKNDSEKIGFTKGPDIYEKSVVLPQILSRLADRQKALNEQKNFKRKLKLDTSSRLKPTHSSKVHLEQATSNPNADTTQVTLNPEVLTEDCNSEKLKALKLRLAFRSLVNTGNSVL